MLMAALTLALAIAAAHARRPVRDIPERLPEALRVRTNYTLARSRPSVECPRLLDDLPAAPRLPCTDPPVREQCKHMPCRSTHGRKDLAIARTFFDSPLMEGCVGTFIELGAWDGLTGSNTLHFEDRGWRGLCIEPSPKNFARLAANRPSCVNVNALITQEVGEETYLSTSDQGYAGVERFIDLQKLELQHVKVLSRRKISAVPLRHVLTRSGLQHVDFFSLDVEGGELEVLRSVDFGTTSFGVLLIENGVTEPILSLLELNGYFLYGELAEDALWVNSCLFRRSAH